VLYLLVTSLVVPESSGLSSPVRDSWESTHLCTDHFDSNAKKKGTLLWWEHKWGNWWDIPYACMCGMVGFMVDVWMVFSTVIGLIF
jgi:hypothetical protein